MSLRNARMALWVPVNFFMELALARADTALVCTFPLASNQTGDGIGPKASLKPIRSACVEPSTVYSSPRAMTFISDGLSEK